MKNIALCVLLISGCCLLCSKAEEPQEAESEAVAETEAEVEDQDALIRDYHKIENVLLVYLKKAILYHESKLDLIKTMREYVVGDYELKLDPYRYASDPIQQFKLLKRFAFEWKEIHKMVLYNSIEDLDNEYRERIANFTLPTMDDFRGVVNDYLEIQRTRNIPTTDLADGNFPGAKYRTPLRSDECHAIASYNLYDPEKIPIALDWLKEAQARFDEKKDFRDYQRMLTLDLAYALAESGQLQEAADLTEKMSWTVPYNEFQYADMYMYFKARLENRRVGKLIAGALKNETTLEVPLYLPFREKFLTKICNKQFALSPSYIAKLKCRYTTNNHNPLFILSPLKEEELYLMPKVSIYRQFLSDSEVDRIIDISHGQMADSGIRVSPSATGRKTVYRSSKSYFIFNGIPSFEYMLKRTDHLVGLSNETAEEIQVTYYDAGGFYTSHYDSFPFDFELPNGNRIATVLFYLNDGMHGGETALYNLNLLVEPEKGSALVWDNLKRNGLVNLHSGHGACPVIQGHKWIATRWFHFRGQVFHRPCTLDKDE